MDFFVSIMEMNENLSEQIEVIKYFISGGISREGCSFFDDDDDWLPPSIESFALLR